MRSSSQALTNVALIRDYQSRQARPAPAEPTSVEKSAVPLLERWHAPVLSEEEIEAWAVRYRLCPKSGMSFVEYLIVRGVGHLA